MKRLVNKLRSNGGATLLFAILVFMLCALVGTAALTAAAANSGRYTHIKAEQQAYLSMASAVNLMRDELVGKTFKAQVATETTNTPGSTPTTNWVAGPPTYDGGVFDTQLEKIFTDFYLKKLKDDYGITGLGTVGTPPYTETLTITPEDPDMNKYPVTAEFAVDANFNITVKFFFMNGTEVSEAYRTDMNIRTAVPVITTASTSSTDGTGTTTTTTTYTMEVTWLEKNTTIIRENA